MATQTNQNSNKRKCVQRLILMDDETVEKLLESLIEDYSKEELEDEAFMMSEMSTVLGVSGEEVKTLLAGAKEIQKLREHVIPDWKQLLKMH